MTEPTPEFQEPQMPTEGEQPTGTVEETQDLENDTDEDAQPAANDERQY